MSSGLPPPKSCPGPPQVHAVASWDETLFAPETESRDLPPPPPGCAMPRFDLHPKKEPLLTATQTW